MKTGRVILILLLVAVVLGAALALILNALRREAHYDHVEVCVKKKNVEATLIGAGITIATAKASIDAFKEGWKSESKKHKLERYLVGAGTAFAAIVFGMVTYVGVYDMT